MSMCRFCTCKLVPSHHHHRTTPFIPSTLYHTPTTMDGLLFHVHIKSVECLCVCVCVWKRAMDMAEPTAESTSATSCDVASTKDAAVVLSDDVNPVDATSSDAATDTKPVVVVRPTTLRLTPCCSSLQPASNLQRARATTVCTPPPSSFPSFCHIVISFPIRLYSTAISVPGNRQ